MILDQRRFQQRAALNGCFTPLVRRALLASLASTAISLLPPAFAQGSPIPGSGSSGSASQASPYGGNSYANPFGAAGGAAGTASPYGNYNAAGSPAASFSAPVPGSGHGPAATAAPSAKGPGSKYKELPITVDSAKYRLEELRAMLAVTRPQEMEDSVQELCEWLNEAADAHYRMYLAFAKSDLTRPQANSEKQLNQHFSQLKREAQLLRADLLIKQMRAPEALAPLVDIVVADPRSNTGKEAYKRLVDLGFSQGIVQPQPAAQPAVSSELDPVTGLPLTPAATSATAPVKAPATVPVVSPKDIKTQANNQRYKPLN